ncbi:MAG: hypothetical protein ABII12_02630 [Planctomycetota bacterium]
MKSSKICFHNIDQPAGSNLPEYRVVGTTTNRDELRTLVGIEDISALIIDLDVGDALDIVVHALEIRPQMAVIGVTGSDDVHRVIMAQRAGCSQLTRKPLSENDLAAALRRALNQTNTRLQEGLTVAVMGSAGGVGATTFAGYLAMAMAVHSPHGAAAIDLDLEFGTLSHLWDFKPKHTIADLAAAQTIDKLLVEDMIVELPCGVGVLARPPKISQADSVNEGHVALTIGAARALHPYVVIDLPRKLDAITGCTIESCDRLIVVANLTFAGVHNAVRLSDALADYGLSRDKLEFVINRYHKGCHSVTTDTLEKRVSKKLLGLLPNNYKALSAAMDIGQPVPPRNPVRKAIQEIADGLCSQVATDSQPQHV